ncbi:MAG: glycosyltransferase [Verrucomicrobiae bacterium]|nr:glycosyltransferase [Verrucomicrobiae bacterium]MCX7722079.1 glycosyltransferase [Verrucomicrobiae bacterium]MDW7980188.1 glycosyltransferase family 2 protein [Verrucomicrobiales bacterium]
MKFSIVTPSFRNSQWLKLCIASVADQQGVELEHIVQDAGSDDGTLDWLPHDRRVRAFIEKDNGMYDAINRGWRRATGEILAYLNCDEQYLPGALQAVAEFFRAHPDTDVVFADVVVVDGHGSFICYRKSLVPWPHVVWVYFPILTCATFIHRRVLDQHGVFFDTRWRDLGDFFWVYEMMQRKLKMRVLRHFTSVFTDTGANMNLGPNAQRERRLKDEMTPRWILRLRWPLVQLHRARQVLRGVYFQKPFSYSIYTLQSPDRRVTFQVAKPTGIWWTRH